MGLWSRMAGRRSAASPEAADAGAPAPADSPVAQGSGAGRCDLFHQDGLPDSDVVLLTRSGCHLCEVAAPVVDDVAARHGASVSVLDVDSDEELRERYTAHVPVVFVRSGLLDYWRVDETRLDAALAGRPVQPPAAL